MSKQYHTLWISVIGMVTISLAVTLSPQGLLSGHGVQGLVDCAQAEEDSHYGADGYDSEGRDQKGYDRKGFDGEGYSRDGHDREGYNKEGYKEDGHDREGHYNSARDRHGRHDTPASADDSTQTSAPAQGTAQDYKGGTKPTAVKQY